MRRSSHGRFKKHARFVSCQAKTEGICGISEKLRLLSDLTRCHQGPYRPQNAHL
ncbi:hypothetical protein CROQUDRAFT_663936 [Cronartium quercuum f. sp. fusiforme G11]|uniref:Uncharacterized protein n=1 Tax=Cronartium quercuum f. sp. fusiforme G11 TaxID=708437 RepID=A0A9P6N988_9BASI|nr:hypothetical protein CROQUDRAFT_663936 [Cronartium quercuum f. sp. fusiforme G11]